jgi:hypothetical protein
MSRSLKIEARNFGKYKLDLVGVQEVRWGKGGTELAVVHISIEIRLRIMN